MTRLRWTGVAAIVTLWTTVAAGMALTGLGPLDERPVSYLGTDHRSVVLFRVGLLVAAALLAAFHFFVREAFEVPPTFLVAALVGLAGQVVAAIVPISGPGSSHTVHTVGGLVLGISLPVLMGRFAAGQAPGRWRVVAYRLFWLEVAACVAGVLLSRWGNAPIAEILPAGAFHLWVVVVTRWSQSRTALLPGWSGGPDGHERGPDGVCR